MDHLQVQRHVSATQIKCMISVWMISLELIVCLHIMRLCVSPGMIYSLIIEGNPMSYLVMLKKKGAKETNMDE